MAKILVIEDDELIAESLRETLYTERHKVDAATRIGDAHSYLKAFSYDLLIIDWELPDGSGVALCKTLRQSGDQTPILILTARSNVEDKETGLDTGADDYMSKPFQSRELLARIRSLLRRPPVIAGNILKTADLEIDTVAMRVKRGERKIDLQPHELSVLEFLMRNPNVVFSTEQLMRRCWSSDQDISTEAVYTCMRRLRKKISQAGERELITTVHGAGYRFEPDGVE